MSKYKVGDEVVLTRIENAYGDNQGDGHDLPKVVRIKSIESESSSYDYAVEDLDGKYIAVVFEKFMQDSPKVVKREQITVIEPGLTLQYMTNTKKDRVSIIVNGNSVGRIPFERIDQLIALLVTLQEQV